MKFEKFDRFRLFLLLAIVIYPLWGAMLPYLGVAGLPSHFWPRLIFSAFPVSVLLGSYRWQWVSARLEGLTYAVLFSLTAHYFLFVAANPGSVFLVTGTYITVIAVAVIFQTRLSLLAYSAWVLLLCLLLPALPPEHPKQALLGGLATVMLLTYITTSARLNLLEREQSARQEAERSAQVIQEQQAMLIHSSKLSALGEMSAGMAHEINNPLSIIVSRADYFMMLAQSGELEMKDAIRSAEVISNTAMRIHRIVNALRAFSRRTDGEPLRGYALKTVIDDTLELCKQRFKEGGIALEVPEDRNGLKVICRPVELSQAILNLLNNAYDAVESGGESGAKWVKVETLNSGSAAVRIRVTDSGPGIPEDIRAKIMQPFFTTKEVGKGTGLGLSVSRGMIEAQGGRLELDSAAAHTSFVIEIPRAT